MAIHNFDILFAQYPAVIAEISFRDQTTPNLYLLRNRITLFLPDRTVNSPRQSAMRSSHKLEGGEHMADQNYSQKVRAGSRTYFIDLKRTKEDKPYLLITESRYMGEGKERERASIVVFQDHAQEFLKRVEEMIKKLE